MRVSSQLKWKGAMAFDVSVDGHTIKIDADERIGGADEGPRPKKLLLAALGGCAGMDVVSILKKMRVNFDSLSIDVQACQTEAEHPHVYENFEMVFCFEGEELEKSQAKIEKAVSLSHERYCGVSAMLLKATSVTQKIKINGKVIE